MQPPCGALVPSHRSICSVPTQECLLGVHADVTAFLGRRDCINGSYRLAFVCVCVCVCVCLCNEGIAQAYLFQVSNFYNFTL